MANKLSPIGVSKHLKQDYDIRATGALRVLLIKAGNTIASQIATAATLAAFTTAVEPTDSTYAAQTPTGVAWSDAASNAITLAGDAVEFSNAGDQSAESIVGALTCIYTGATKADWIPLNWTEFDVATNLAGTALPVEWSGGILANMSETIGTGRVYSSGIMACLNHTINVTTASVVWSTLVNSTTTALAADHVNPADMTLGEIDDTGHVRQHPTGVAWAASGTRVILQATKPTWPNNGDATAPATKMLHWLNVDGTDANDLMLSCQPLSTPWTPPGTARAINLPASGLCFLQT